jgi:hypothetical protein
MLNWPELRLPPINLYNFNLLTRRKDVKIEIKERKTKLNKVNLSDLYAKRVKG